MPRYCLYLLPLIAIILPGDSSVPARRLPSITHSAPAAIAFATSPLYLIPPSAITGTSYSIHACATEAIAVICGTPTPATTLVVQIEPGPIPTLRASISPEYASAAEDVAIFPAITSALTLPLISFIDFTTLMFNCPSMVMEMSTDTLFHTAIEALVDIAIIIETSMSESQKVGDYEKFAALFDGGFIGLDEYNGLRRLNGFRNAVVHAYDSLILDEIYDNYESIINDIGQITQLFCEKL